jgi:hypothetical protein
LEELAAAIFMAKMAAGSSRPLVTPVRIHGIASLETVMNKE